MLSDSARPMIPRTGAGNSLEEASNPTLAEFGSSYFSPSRASIRLVECTEAEPGGVRVPRTGPLPCARQRPWRLRRVPAPGGRPLGGARASLGRFPRPRIAVRQLVVFADSRAGLGHQLAGDLCE